MRILFINGSPRKNGYTVQVMRHIEEGVGPEHAVEWIHAYDLAMKPCQGCLRCRPDRECGLPQDDGHGVWRKIRVADALVIGSPTYFGNVTGPLKTLIDRSLTALETLAASGLETPVPAHAGQKAAMVTACNVPFPVSQLPSQAKGALQAMETVLKAGGYEIAGSILFDGAAAQGGVPAEIEKEALRLGRLLAAPGPAGASSRECAR
jgi:NAD(P)H-dependent FMN reductase